MKWYIDAGATKMDWIGLTNEGHMRFETKGFNPLKDNESVLDKILQSVDKQHFNIDSSLQISYFGTGCSTKKGIAILRQVWLRHFPNATVNISTDLVGAASLLSPGKPSIVAILGTGSNSCLYNGKTVIDQVANLGYMLGDEGGGYHIGREIIRAYFYREMPVAMTNEFHDSYKLSRNEMVTKLYSGKESPTALVASFAEFAVKHRKDPFIKQLVKSCFKEFINRHLKKYHTSGNLPVHFVGSIAFLFKDELLQTLQEHHIIPGHIIRRPLDLLV